MSVNLIKSSFWVRLKASVAIHRLKFIVGVVDYHKPVISRKDKQILHAILSLTKTAHSVVLSVVKKAEFNAKIQIKSLKLKFKA